MKRNSRFTWMILFLAGLVYGISGGRPLPPGFSSSIEGRAVLTGPSQAKKTGRFQAAGQKIRHGIGSWYSRKSPGVKKMTASGEHFDDSKKTCASWHYAFGTRLKVTNLENGKSVVCRVNDRGPSKRLRRVVDLSKAAFSQIGELKRGLIRVSVIPVQ